MKKSVLYTLVLGLFLFSSSFILNDVASQISTHFKTANAKALSGMCSSSVEISLDGNTASYSKTQAQFVLEDFFAKNSPKSFTKNHEGNSAGGMMYVIGTYSSSTGNFRVYSLLKPDGGTLKISKIQITKN